MLRGLAAIGGAALLVTRVAGAQVPPPASSPGEPPAEAPPVEQPPSGQPPPPPMYPAPAYPPPPSGYPGPYGWAPPYQGPAPEQKARPTAGAPSGLLLRVGAGAFYTKIFAVTSYGGEGFFAIGSASKKFAWDGGMHVAKGTTLHGLGILKWRVAFSFEWPIGVVRLGMGPSLGYMSMQSATFDDVQQRNEALAQLSFGGELHASVDLLQLSRRDTIFVRGSFQFESGAYGPMLGLGYRWEAWAADE